VTGAILVVALGAVGAHLVTGHSDGRAASVARIHGTRPATRTVQTVVASDSFTTLSGANATLTSLRGSQPAVIWFVARGCAGCAASVPAMAYGLDQLTADGVMVITLGIYGAFPAGNAGIAELTAFAQSASADSLNEQRWVWGLASRGLSETYDPSGAADVYVLLGANGQVHYSNSEPATTLPQLLAAAAPVAKAAAQSASAAMEAMPCC